MVSGVMARDSMSETYSDLQDMLQKLARKLAWRWRHDHEEFLSIANETFVEAFGEYNPRKGSFNAFIYKKVFHKLQEYHRTFMRRRILGKVANFDATLCQDNYNPHWVSSFMDDLGRDGRIVAELTIDSPKEVIHAITVKGDSPNIRKKAISEYLSDLGWGAERVLESFSEIAEALR